MVAGGASLFNGTASRGRRTMKRAPSTCGASSVRGCGRAVLGPDPAAMRFDDLLGDRQAKARILAEALMRPVGVEALEDLVEGVGPDAGAVVVDDDLDVVRSAAGR